MSCQTGNFAHSRPTHKIRPQDCCEFAASPGFQHLVALTDEAAFGINYPVRGGRMSGQAGVVAVTCLALEAGIARGPGVSVLCNQSSGLRAALRAAIAHGASGIISFGIAGGLAPNLVAGDWVVASGVKTGKDVIATDRAWAQRLLELLPNAIHAHVLGVDSVIAAPGGKLQLHDETGAAAVDMESHVAAEIAAEHRIPFAACRVIIDAAHRTLPPAATPARCARPTSGGSL